MQDASQEKVRICTPSTEEDLLRTWPDDTIFPEGLAPMFEYPLPDDEFFRLLEEFTPRYPISEHHRRFICPTKKIIVDYKNKRFHKFVKSN